MGVGFMALMAAVMILLPYPLISAPSSTSTHRRTRQWSALAVGFLAFAGLFQIVDGAQAVAAACCAACTTPRCR